MSENLKVVLASASPARRDLLISAGVNPLIINSHLDEETIIEKLAAKSPAEIVISLAKLKAQKVISEHQLPRVGVLIAADSMWELNDQLVGKPQDRQEAKQRILEMSSKTGVLHTGHFVMNLESQKFETAVIATNVEIDQITELEVERYLDTGEPLQVAGSFTLNGYGSAFVKSVAGDANNVIGLSINTVKKLCSSVGLNWTDFWKNQK